MSLLFSRVLFDHAFDKYTHEINFLTYLVRNLHKKGPIFSFEFNYYIENHFNFEVEAGIAHGALELFAGEKNVPGNRKALNIPTTIHIF